jgi:hypothetical protein
MQVTDVTILKIFSQEHLSKFFWTQNNARISQKNRSQHWFSRKAQTFFAEKSDHNIDLNRVARFFLVQHTKTGKIYQMVIKYFQWP